MDHFGSLIFASACVHLIFGSTGNLAKFSPFSIAHPVSRDRPWAEGGVGWAVEPGDIMGMLPLSVSLGDG